VVEDGFSARSMVRQMEQVYFELAAERGLAADAAKIIGAAGVSSRRP
jgi:hypothetical protein